MRRGGLTLAIVSKLKYKLKYTFHIFLFHLAGLQTVGILSTLRVFSLTERLMQSPIFMVAFSDPAIAPSSFLLFTWTLD